MRRTLALAFAVILVAMVTGSASGATDLRVNVVKDLGYAIGHENDALAKLRKGFEAAAWWKKGKSKADDIAFEIGQDLRSARTNLIVARSDALRYLQDAGSLSPADHDRAVSGVSLIRDKASAAETLDQSARNVSLEHDVSAYVEDTDSRAKKAKVQADVEVITRDVERALTRKRTALDAAHSLPQVVPHAKGSGAVTMDPNGTCDGYPCYDISLNLDQATAQKTPGFDIVFPTGYQGGPATVPAGYSCAINPSGEGGFAPDFYCQWSGTGTVTANVTVDFFLYNALAAADNGKVMVCYGSGDEGWSATPPPFCFFLSGP
jgi:hypothetical protein